MATSIIANNVQVTFAAFAMGIALVGTVIVLVTNGVNRWGVRAVRVEGDRIAAAQVRRAARCAGADGNLHRGGAGFLLAAALLIPGLVRGQAREERKARDSAHRGVDGVAAYRRDARGFVSPIET
jgi:hypothetical protein